MESREETERQPVYRSPAGREEQRLIEAAQNGDTAAFGRLVRIHQRRLFRFIVALVGSFDTTEDIVQEAFIRAFQAIRRFRTGAEFYPWLARIARNLAYNRLVREQLKQWLESLQAGGFDPVSVELGPLDRLMEDENSRRFYRALLAMPAQYRAVCVLRHFEGLDYAEIASYLKIPPGTVDSRLYRARRFLMKELKDLL